MPSHKCWHHDEEQSQSERKSKEQVRVQTDKRVDEEKRQGVCRVCPVHKVYNLVLEGEDDSNPAVTRQ